MLRRNAVSTLLAFLLILLPGIAPYASAVASPTFSYQSMIRSPLIVPTNVAADAAGNLVFVDYIAKKVFALTSDGSLRFTISGNDTPRSVAVDFDDHILVGYQSDGQPGYVALYDPEGRFLRFVGSGYGEFGTPVSIAVSLHTGRIYVLDSGQNNVKVYEGSGNPALNADGSRIQFGSYGHNSGTSPLSNPGKFDSPSGIAVDDIRNEVLIADKNNYRVQIFDMNGNFKTAFGKAATTSSWGTERPPSNLTGRFYSMRGLTVDSLGRIYVSDAGLRTVQVLDRNGNFLAFIGEPGYTPDKMITPMDCTIDNQNRLIVPDFYLNRATIFAVDAGPAIPNIAPLAPVKMGPAEGSLLYTATPVLAVYNSRDINNNTLAYRFEIDISPYFNSHDLVAFTTPQGTPYTAVETPALHDRGTYFWRVRAEETSTPEHLVSEWSAISTFSIFVNNAPSVPFGLLPGDGGVTRKADFLSWGASTDPNAGDTVTYALELSETADFSKVIQSRTGMTATTVSIESLFAGTAIKGDTRYFWRVKAIDNYNESSAWSGTSSFFVFVNQSPSVPAGLSPSDGSTIKKTDSIGWGASTDPNAGDTVTYTLELSETADFSKIIQSWTGMTGTAIGVESLFAGTAIKGDTRYYWHVKAVDSHGDSSAWSGTGSFFVLVNLPPSAPANLMPDNDSLVRKIDFLSWGASIDPNPGDLVIYSAELSETADFTKVVHSKTGMATTTFGIGAIAGTALKADTRYFWRVRGVDSFGASSAWSSTANFVYTETRLLITSSLEGVRVYLDGNYSHMGKYAGTTGASPLVITDIKPGRHVVRLEKEGYFGRYSSIVIEDGRTQTYSATLIKDTTGARNQAGVLLDDRKALGGKGKLSLDLAKPFLVDWNNDGKKDMLAGDKQGKVYLFLNIAGDSAPDFRLSPNHEQGVVADVGSRAVPFMVDWNNDGKKDLLAGSGNGMVWLYLNEGADEAPRFMNGKAIAVNASSLKVSGNAAPFVADWNNDGKKDLLVGESSGRVRLFINTGNDESPLFASAGNVVQGLPVRARGGDLRVDEDAVPFVTDFNLDGTKDLLVGGGHELVFFPNLGSDSAPLFNASGKTQLGHRGIAPLVADYGNDGYSDMIVGDEKGDIRYYQFRPMNASPRNTAATK